MCFGSVLRYGFQIAGCLSSLSPVRYPWQCETSGWQSVNVCKMNG